jgi:aryl-alcohol dehydrogenase-like predicted oxidoreductase
MELRIMNTYSRREALKAGALTGVAVALGGASATSIAAESSKVAPGTSAPMLTKPIPSTGEKIPVVGLGTNQFGVDSDDEIAARRDVLKRLPELGGAVIDTAPAYGRSEEVVGRLVRELENRKRLFLATKVTCPDGDIGASKVAIEQSFARLRADVIDLLQVHNLDGTDALAPVMKELKEAKRVRYLGITTSRDEQHAEVVASLRKHAWDFVQVNYSIDDREAAKEVLPFAQERGVAVLINVPFGGRRGGSLFARVADKPLPKWAAEFDAASWGQFFLKYSLSHPAVTCAIPGMTKLAHLEDNAGGGKGRLPDATARKRMEEFWDSLT